MFPLGGVDQSLPTEKQPPATASDALNVRSLSAGAARASGGRRPGLVKAMTQAAGSSTEGTRITGVGAMIRQASAVAQGNTYNAFVEDFNFAPFDGTNIPFRTNLFPWLTPFVQAATGATNRVHSPNDQTITSWTAGNITAFAAMDAGGRPKLLLQPAYGGAPAWDGQWTGVAISHPTTNDVTMDLEATPNNSVKDGFTERAVFVRGSADLSSKVVAYVFSPGGSNYRLRISRLSGSPVAETVLGESPDFTLGSSSSSIAQGFRIRLVADSISIRAEWTWDGVLNGGPATVTVDDSINATNNRAGFLLLATGTGAEQVYQRIRRVQVSVLAQQAERALATVSGRIVPPGTPPANNLGVPPGVRAGAVRINAGSGSSHVVGSGGEDTNTWRYWPTANQIRALVNFNASVRKVVGPSGTVNSAHWLPWFYPVGQGNQRQWAVEVSWNTASTSTADEFGAIFRTSALTDGNQPIRSGLYVRVRRRIDTEVRTGQTSQLTAVEVFAFDRAGGTDPDLSALGAAVASGTFTFSATNAVVSPVINLQLPMRIEDNRDRIRIRVGGTVVWESGSLSQFLSDPAGHCAAVARADTGASNFQGEQVRFIDITPAPAQPTPNPGTIDLVVVAGGRAHVGNLSDPDAPWRATEARMPNQLPMFAAYGGKWYGVDGSGSWIVDPITGTATPWTASVGTLEPGCQLVAAWKGRLVVARPPGNPALFLMSRSLQPRDFDVGSTVDPATKAVTGNTASIGQPPDPITALIPYADDYLIFGCGSSMHILEGDPGRGGTLSALSAKVGVLGPRAWAFDEMGSLYTLTQSGLYRIARGTRTPENVSRRRLVRLMEAIDLSAVLPQMAYDAARRCVHLFLTPMAGTVGTHVVYDTASDALWIDQYPATMQPWGVADLEGQTYAQRTVLLGGDDGFLRRYDDAATGDDGTGIDSWVRVGPMELDEGMTTALAMEVQAVGITGPASVDWQWRTGNSGQEVAAQAVTSPAAASGTWALTNGFQVNQGLRQAGGSHQLIVRHNGLGAPWSLAEVRAVLRPERRRRFP